ncbi:Oidioi.mRNA.OKI2018_I69.XSR.g16536.t1.cds [Oikopleura dioica]|uniref:Oidioi.mRNA.OKI2018_I69.XSR.g16536.t1.cds n=1 Tax=Oikopleura dioica TaxID=34765 RepID=A0ABN7SQS1_OIKDI|nr:Oidioi.mRNA.OKI2018_I69.XSR.g16536.t1.cds [Oikopleura dioica]
MAEPTTGGFMSTTQAAVILTESMAELNSSSPVIPETVMPTEAFLTTTGSEDFITNATSIAATQTSKVNFVEWDLDLDIRNTISSNAGWEIAFAWITIIFAVVIALYGPYVFGSDRLITGMNVATEMMEFFFPVQYVGKPASEKITYYSHEAYVSKIRRFSLYIALTMTGISLFEYMVGQIGSCALADHENGGGSPTALHAHVVLCVFAGVLSFSLTVAAMLMFKRGFLPEVMMVYGIRNAFMVFFFTSTWVHAMGFDKKMNDSLNSLKSGIDDFRGNF